MDDSTQLNRGVEERKNNEEYIIDLTDIVEKGPDFIDKAPDKESFSTGETGNDEIIELTSMVEDDSDRYEIDVLSMSNDSPDIETEESSSVESESIKPYNDVLVDHPQLTEQQLETVLEKIIKEKFSQKIETTIFQVVEKVVAKEIADIKKTMAEL